MKVLQITAYSGWGCTGRHAVGIADAMAESGAGESTVAWGRRNTAPDRVNTVQIGTKSDYMIHGLMTRLTDKCGFYSQSATIKFLKWVDKYKPDVVHLRILHGYYINLELLFKYLKKNKIPVVWTFHDCWAITGHCPYFDYIGCEKWKNQCHHCEKKKEHPASWLLDNSRWNYSKKKELFNLPDNLTVVAPSEWLAGLVRQSFLKEKKITVINNGTDITVFKPTETDFRQKYNLGDKKIVLGVSSSWADTKGLNVFIELSSRLPEEYRIVLIGLKEEQIASLPDIITGIKRTDSTEELAAAYTAADVFVNPTYEDNYPTTNLEAIACGTAVVAYNAGGSGEAVRNFNAGIVVEKGDIQGLETAVLKIVAAGMNAKHVDPEELSEITCGKKYIELYKEICGIAKK